MKSRPQVFESRWVWDSGRIVPTGGVFFGGWIPQTVWTWKRQEAIEFLHQPCVSPALWIETRVKIIFRGKLRWRLGCTSLPARILLLKSCMKWHPKFRVPKEWKYLVEMNEKSLYNVNDHLLITSSVFRASHDLDWENIKKHGYGRVTSNLPTHFPASAYKWKRHKWWHVVHKFAYSVSLLGLKFNLECEFFSSNGSAENSKDFGGLWVCAQGKGKL